jgi:AcrR family transcriptional regulator
MGRAPDRRAERHGATRNRILPSAWSLARDRGLAGWSLRDVASEVGMRAPSLYGYFDSKNALYDAMFAEGYTALLTRIEATSRQGGAGEVLHRAAHLFFDFSVEDPARYQLLFLRTVPGFTPTADSYLHAQRVLGELAAVLAAAGVGNPHQVDLWTALLTGLASQQISNDPGGERWQRLIDPAVDMLLDRSQAAS